MKKFFIRVVCFLLILSSLLPLAVSCKKEEEPPKTDDPSTENNGGEGGNENVPVSKKDTVTATVTSYDKLPILDLSQKALLTETSSIKNLAFDSSKGVETVKWELNYKKPLTVQLPEPVDINDYYYVEFSVYADAPCNKTFTIEFVGCEAKAEIVMDFAGEQKFRLKQDSITVKNPAPKITAITVSCADETANGGIYAYITSINAVHPVFSYSIPEGVDLSDASIYDTLLNNWTNYQTGNNTSSSISAFTSAISKINSNCKTQWDNFKATYQEGVEGSLYGEETYNPSGDRYAKGIRNVYENMEKMALAYACKHSNYYQNQELLADIIKGLEYEYEYGYGKPVLQNGTYGDWYPWDAAIPAALINILVYIRNDLSQSEINKYLEPFDKILPLPFGTAANLLFMTKNVVLSAALQKDGKRIANANCLMQEVFRYIDEIPADEPRSGNLDGFYTDGSFIQHGGVPYQGSYGIGLLQALAPLMYIGKGSAFEITGDEVHHQYEWIFNSYVPIISGDRQFVAHDGRANTTTGMERANAHRMLGCAIIMANYAPEPYASQLKSMIKYYTVTVGTTPTSYVSISFLEYLDNLNKDSSVAAAAQYIAGKVFGAADTVVQHTAKYSVCVAMSSKRIAKYESINEANETGWYHRDGMIYVYTEGYDFSRTWMFTADPYLMPGTTVNLAKRNDINTPLIYGANTYAGGVEQGKYSVAGMILDYGDEAYTEYWGTQSSYSSLAATKIYAKKSYFMFDNEVVCIGSDIQDESGEDVVTVVENRLWGIRIANNFEKREDYVSINGQLISSPATVETTIEARTMHFTNMGGYVFMRHQSGSTTDKDGNTVTYQKATHSPYASTGLNVNSSQSFLEIKINHGVGDGNLVGKYAYMYLPDATAEETEAYYANPDVLLVRRTSDCHAVIEQTLGIVAANVFAENGAAFDVNNASTALTSVASETPCSIMISKGENGEYKISVSDPTQIFRQVVVEIEIDGISTVTSADNGVSATVNGNVVRAVINTENALGATFDFTIK